MIAETDIAEANILIVDDQEVNILLLQQMLQDAGYKKISATQNPAEVSNLHHEHPYDLILLDLQMPRMDGFEVMEGLKTQADGGYLPVMVVTAQPALKLRALEAGARDFISKPFDLMEVKTRIRNHLETRLLYRQLADHNEKLEKIVQERTAELRESEARYRSLTELASDWYWEQDETGAFTKVSGPVQEMLGMQMDPLNPSNQRLLASGWNEQERDELKKRIAAREPFLDFLFSRTNADGSVQQFRVSGEPMFNRSCRFTGYHGIGVEVTSKAASP